MYQARNELTYVEESSKFLTPTLREAQQGLNREREGKAQRAE